MAKTAMKSKRDGETWLESVMAKAMHEHDFSDFVSSSDCKHLAERRRNLQQLSSHQVPNDVSEQSLEDSFFSEERLEVRREEQVSNEEAISDAVM